ncbi:MAG TPA: hypothetical protein VFB39_02760 [Solirubrobacteraceae bacterium]|nr:hypothetical protein [Solirubrobacteraceae bacterium]
MSPLRHRAKRLLGGAALFVSAFAILALVAAPAGATNVIKWGSKQQIDPPENPVPAHALHVSCATKNLCVAVDESGQVFVSTDPHPLKKNVTPSKWFKAKASDSAGLLVVSCVPTLCVAADHLGRIVFSTHPSSKTATWSGPTAIDGNGISSILCPSASLCVAGDNNGQILSSTDPTGGPGQWTTTPVDPGVGHSIEGVSCPSTSFCVGVDRVGNSMSSINPAGAQWKLHTGIDSTNEMAAVSCPSTKLCVAVDQTNNGGRILATTQPTSNNKWKVQYTDSHFNTPFGVSCPSAGLCIAGYDDGNAITSINPTGGKSAWSKSPHPVDPRYGINNVSCTATALCLTGDNGGYVVTGQLPRPDTKISKSTISKSKHSAAFSFKATGYASGFQCALAKKGKKASYSSCTSPKTYKNLSHGSYTFRVRAFNLAGNDPTPASQGFRL